MDEIKAFKCKRCNRLANELVLQGSSLKWIEEILEGKEVSDFALSFPLVRRIRDLAKVVKEVTNGQFTVVKDKT